MRYALTEKALAALFAFSRREGVALMSAFEQIASDPTGMAERLTVDWEGYLAYGVRYGRFEIAYVVGERPDWVTIALVPPTMAEVWALDSLRTARLPCRGSAGMVSTSLP